MNKKAKRIFLILLIVILIMAFIEFYKSYQYKKNEIRLNIQLDLNEDVGLLVIDSDIEGQKESGGVSNADKKMLKKDELVYWFISKQHHQEVTDQFKLKLDFTVITQYCDPNYENDYPEEYLMPMNSLEFNAEFGNTYDITITGDNINGYHSKLNK